MNTPTSWILEERRDDLRPFRWMRTLTHYDRAKAIRAYEHVISSDPSLLGARLIEWTPGASAPGALLPMFGGSYNGIYYREEMGGNPSKQVIRSASRPTLDASFVEEI